MLFRTHIFVFKYLQSELQIWHKNLAEEKNRFVFATRMPLFSGLQVDFLFFSNFFISVLTGNVQLIKIKHDVDGGYVSNEILWMKGKHSYSLLQTNFYRNFLLDLES